MKTRAKRAWSFLSAAISLIALGLIVRAEQPSPPVWVPLPVNLHLPDGAGAPLSLPTLSPDGPPLVVSNSPEQITSTAPTVVLCRADLTGSRFRVFFHHQNATDGSRQIGLALTNRSGRPVQIYVARSSQVRPTMGPTGDLNPAIAGLEALSKWFASRQGADDAPGQDVYLCTLAPGGFHIIAQAVAGRPGGSETLTEMCDIAPRFATDTSPPTVEVMTLAYRGVPPSASALARLPLTPADPPALGHCRGIFAHDTRRGTLAYAVVDGVPRWLDLSGPNTGRDNHSPTGEYEDAAPTARDPAALRANSGNYGVVYDLNMVLSNPQSVPVRVRCLLNVAGGDGCSVVMVNESRLSGPPLMRAFDSWVFRDVTLAPGAERRFRLRYSLPGGSSGAHRLFFWPLPVAHQARNRCERRTAPAHSLLLPDHQD